MSTRQRRTVGTTSRPADKASAAATISDARIARRAYELYERRGRSDGADLDDWLKAECELREANAQRS